MRKYLRFEEDSSINYSIEELKWWVAHSAQGVGCHCPVCDRINRVWRYSLTKANVLFLRSLLKEQTENKYWAMAKKGFVKINTPGIEKRLFLNGMGGAYYARGKYFGVLEGIVDIGERKYSAYWRVSDRGIKFLNHGAKIPKYVWILNGEFVVASIRRVNVDECMENWSRDERYKGRLNRVPKGLLDYTFKPDWEVIDEEVKREEEDTQMAERSVARSQTKRSN